MKKAKRLDRGEIISELDRLADEQRIDFFASESLADLAVELGGTRPSEMCYGEGRTPHGKRLMAGTGDVLTHFFDLDDGWQKMPEKYGF